MKPLRPFTKTVPLLPALILGTVLCASLASAAVPRAIDINGDGKIDTDDAQAFLDAVAQGTAPALDLDGDGKTGLSDALLYGRWIDGLYSKPSAGLGSLYFQDPADSAAFGKYQDDVKAKQSWGLTQLQSAYPDGTRPFAAPIAGPIEFESEVGDAFAKFSVGLDTAAFRSKVRAQGVAIASGTSFPNFFQALDQIHDADLPLLFTSDALLHTIYLSYDSLLAGMEENRFGPKLDSILAAAEDYAEAHYPADASRGDVDELLGTARLLLNRQRSDVAATATAVLCRGRGQDKYLGGGTAQVARGGHR